MGRPHSQGQRAKGTMIAHRKAYDIMGTWISWMMAQPCMVIGGSAAAWCGYSITRCAAIARNRDTQRRQRLLTIGNRTVAILCYSGMKETGKACVMRTTTARNRQRRRRATAVPLGLMVGRLTKSIPQTRAKLRKYKLKGIQS